MSTRQCREGVRSSSDIISFPPSIHSMTFGKQYALSFNSLTVIWGQWYLRVSMIVWYLYVIAVVRSQIFHSHGVIWFPITVASSHRILHDLMNIVWDLMRIVWDLVKICEIPQECDWSSLGTTASNQEKKHHLKWFVHSKKPYKC